MEFGFWVLTSGAEATQGVARKQTGETPHSKAFPEIRDAPPLAKGSEKSCSQSPLHLFTVIRLLIFPTRLCTLLEVVALTDIQVRTLTPVSLPGKMNGTRPSELDGTYNGQPGRGGLSSVAPDPSLSRAEALHPQAHPRSGSEALGSTFACPEPLSSLLQGPCGRELTVRAPAFWGAQHGLPFFMTRSREE